MDYKLIPAKHIKPMAIKPVKIMAIPPPLKEPGILEYQSFLRMVASATMAKAQPVPELKPKTMDSGKL